MPHRSLITVLLCWLVVLLGAAACAGGDGGRSDEKTGNSQRPLLLEIAHQLLGSTGNRSVCLSSWNATNDVCSNFTGVTCNSDTGAVIALELPNCHLHGTLPAIISQLPMLQAIGFYDNQLDRHNSRGLPPEWGDLQSLSYIDLHNNSISSTLPARWSNMTALFELKLHRNRLSGGLPSEWSRLPVLIFIDLSSNMLDESLPANWGEMRFLSYANFATNKLQGTLPPEWGKLTSLNELDLSSNNIVSSIPPSWAALTVYWLDLSRNCIQIDAATATTLTNSSKLRFFDITPACLEMPPINTTVPLATPYSFRAVNSWVLLGSNVINYAACQAAVYSPVALASLQQVAFGRYQLVFALDNSILIDYAFSCITALYLPTLQCFFSSSSSSSTGSSSSGGADEQPCNVSLAPLPIWHGQTVPVAPSMFGSIDFDGAADGQYLHGATYRIHFQFGFNVPVADPSLGLALYQPINVSTPMFLAPPCQANAATRHRDVMAVPLSTSCAPCPALHAVANAEIEAADRFARCDGSTVARVGAQPAWRIRDDVLPFYECPRGATQGCFDNASQNATNESSGALCKASYRGPLCTRCAVGYSMSSDGECSVCPSKGATVLLFGLGVAVLALMAAVLVFVSLKPRRHLSSNSGGNKTNFSCCCCSADDDDDDDSDSGGGVRCVEAAKSSLHDMKPKLGRLVVVLRQLINHWTLVGALSNTSAAASMSGAFRALLRVQQGANTFAVGNFASSALQCVMPHEWSKVVLDFNTIWIVFGCVFLAESLLFFAWTRRAAVAATVALFLSFVAYSPLVGSAAKLLSLCHKLTFFRTSDYLLRQRGPSNVIGNLTVRLLASDLSQECTDDFNKHYLVAGWLTVVFFALGLPLLVGVVYRLLLLKQPELRDEIFSFLTKRYKKSIWYYELLLLVRKLCVSLIVGVLPGRDQLQLQLFTVVCAVMLALACALQPLEHATYNRAEQLSIASAILCSSAMTLVVTFDSEDAVLIAATVFAFISQVVANGVIVYVFLRNSSGGTISDGKKTTDDGDYHAMAAAEAAATASLLPADERSEMGTAQNDDDDERDPRIHAINHTASSDSASTAQLLCVQAENAELREQLEQREQQRLRLEELLRQEREENQRRGAELQEVRAMLQKKGRDET